MAVGAVDKPPPTTDTKLTSGRTIDAPEALERGRHCVGLPDVLAAHDRIAAHIHRTPVLTCRSLDALLSFQGRIYFKVEALQKTGSFKIRGACNAIFRHVGNGVGDGRSVAVVTHSSGNHAQAVALASSLAGGNCRATIVMPRDSPRQKLDAVKSTYGAEVVLCASDPLSREKVCDEISAEKRRVGGADVLFVHPSDDPDVIAGQGTVCVEMVEQCREMQSGTAPDVIIIPVGGGGLASGNCVALRGMLGEAVKIVLAEPARMADAKRSFDSGHLQGHRPSDTLDSVTDGLKTILGPNTWPIVRDLADDIMTVSEEEILRATKNVWERMKILIEPSAGVGVAVALSRDFAQKYGGVGVTVGVVLCGGNVDVLKISKLISELPSPG